MCSVIGVYSKHDKDVSAEAFVLLSTLSRRGPEAAGVKTPEEEKKGGNADSLLPLPKGPVVLGHCLLSVTGHAIQPVDSGKVSVAHNGEIYNYRAMLPHSPGFSSDAEAIAGFLSVRSEEKGFEQAVRDFFGEAEGEFAVGVLCNGSLYAFRDFLGIKPLWFGENADLVAFASEPQALSKVGIQMPNPLMPGHLLELSANGARTKKIFTLEDFRKSVPRSHSLQRLYRAFQGSVSVQCAGLERAAVLFSGGVDSSLLAKEVSKHVKGAILFAAGTEGCADFESAELSANALKLPLRKITLDGGEIQRLASRSMEILSRFDAMQIGLAVPELACAEEVARENGLKVVFSGQGSDEVFAGYASYANALRERGFVGVEEDTWSALSRMPLRNFYRDDAIISSMGLELRVPFMAREFLREAMAFPASEKILSPEDILRKHPVRAMARLSGLPDFICSRPKKAMQYGSGVQKTVTRLMRGSTGNSM